MIMSKMRIIIIGLLVLTPALVFGQLSTGTDEYQNKNIELNTITTAVPFLLIAPDSRSGGIGDAGVALSPDAASIHWNASKLAFAKNEFELSLSYSPWLRALVNDMNLAYLSGYKKLSKTQALSAGLRYFSLGSITFTDESGTALRDFKPSEFSFDVAFAQKLSDKFSGGIGARYIHSNLTGGVPVQGANSKPGRSVAVDVSFFYTKDRMKVAGKKAVWNWGLNISNIGAKMSYTETAERDFLPANLRLGTAFKINLDDYNSLTFTVDANKLLVPTPATYHPEDETLIASGKDSNVGTAQAMIQSFSDAPGVVTYTEVDDDLDVVNVESGSVFKEELREINLGGGFEYWYDQQFAFRAGYFYEAPTKGNRQFITLGASLKYTAFAIDMSYLISTTQQNPLANTLRFTLRLEFEKLTGGGSDKEEG